MRNRILTIFTLVAFSGCATGALEKSGVVKPTEAQVAPVVPSYEAKVSSIPLEQVRAVPAAPANKWETLPLPKVMEMANAAMKSKDYLQVEKIGDFLARASYLTPWGPYYLAMAAESRHDYPRAVWMLELALKKAPKEGLFHYELGRIHWELKADSEAIKHLKLASELNPTLTGAHWVLGQMAMQRQDYSEASKLLEKALVSDSGHGPSLLAMAQLKMLQKEWDRAETYLLHAIAVYPRSSKARLALAQVQESHLNKLGEALRTYKQLKQLVADHKLDESVTINLDEKIQALQKNVAQVHEAGKVSQRQPATEAAKGPVKQ